MHAEGAWLLESAGERRLGPVPAARLRSGGMSAAEKSRASRQRRRLSQGTGLHSHPACVTTAGLRAVPSRIGVCAADSWAGESVRGSAAQELCCTKAMGSPVADEARTLSLDNRAPRRSVVHGQEVANSTNLQGKGVSRAVVLSGKARPTKATSGLEQPRSGGTVQAVTVSQAAQLEYATAKATPQQVCYSRLGPAMLCAHLNLQELLRIWCGHRSEFIVRVQDTSNALKGG